MPSRARWRTPWSVAGWVVATGAIGAGLAAIGVAVVDDDAAPDGVVGLLVDNCDPGLENGSGMLVDGGLVLTAAHVVAGADEIRVTHGDTETGAAVVAFDPEMDLALVRPREPIDATPLPIDSAAIGGRDESAGTNATAWVVRSGEVVAVPVTLVRRLNIRTENVYVEGETLRPGYEISAEIDFGDSGGAVVVDGEIVGVLWARSGRAEGRAYAIDPDRAGQRLRDQIESGRLGDDIDLTRCG